MSVSFVRNKIAMMKQQHIAGAIEFYSHIVGGIDCFLCGSGSTAALLALVLVLSSFLRHCDGLSCAATILLVHWR